MKYSIIICYRDRQAHLDITVPRLKEVFKDKDHEIIVVEQVDNKKFRRGNLFNVGAKYATGDILIFHDVDHYPADNVKYWNDTSEVFLPIQRVIYVYNDLTEKPLEEVPGGYRHFRNGVDDNFYGGIEVFTKEAFFKVNGYNHLYVGWGFEESDLRERVHYYGLSAQRGYGLFYALDHPDSGPAMTDSNFQNNIRMSQQWQHFLSFGINNMPFECSIKVKKHEMVDMWLGATAFDLVSNRPIKYSNFDFTDE